MRIRKPRSPSSIACACLLVAACAGARLERVDSAASPTLPATAPARELVMRDDWRTCGLETFEGWVQAELPGDRPVVIAPATLRMLASALDAQDVVSLRAAVVLGRARTAEAYEALLQRLEKRIEGRERADDAADVVGAASLTLARGLGIQNLGKRLERLAIGANPHPDLEVRVECAATLLAFKRTQTVNFLLRVLRDQTRAANDARRDWTPTPHMAWAKGRAATALAHYLEAPNTFRADSSIDEQARQAARLERLFRRKQRETDAVPGR